MAWWQQLWLPEWMFQTGKRVPRQRQVVLNYRQATIKRLGKERPTGRFTPELRTHATFAQMLPILAMNPKALARCVAGSSQFLQNKMKIVRQRPER
jgi:hypothetical protein